MRISKTICKFCNVGCRFNAL
ncbi:MAG: hypothetical protein ABR502_01805 [Chitinophagaceae bacterium]